MNIHKLRKTLPCSEEDLLMESIVCPIRQQASLGLRIEKTLAV